MMLFKLAIRNIFRQRRRSLLTALSMTGGYILCVFSVSLSEGSYNNAISFFTLDHTGHIQIHKDNYVRRPKIHKTIDDPVKLAKVLDENDAVRSFTFRIFAPALAYSSTKNSPVSVIGVDLTRERTTSRLAEKVSAGRYIDNKMNIDGYYSAMIGAGIANSLKLGLGGELILISQGADGSIANDIFIVQGIVGKKDSLDRLTVFLPLIAAQEFLSMHGRVHEVSILVNDDKANIEIGKKIQSQLPELKVSPWQEVEETFYKSMQADKRGNLISLCIIIFIVFVGVLNTVLMSVLERTREFGVLKAIGSRPLSISLLITLETSLLTLMSLAAGFVFALPLIAWFASTGITLSQPLDVGGVLLTAMTGDLSVLVFAGPAIAILIFGLIVSVPAGIRAARILPTAAMGSH